MQSVRDGPRKTCLALPASTLVVATADYCVDPPAAAFVTEELATKPELIEPITPTPIGPVGYDSKTCYDFSAGLEEVFLNGVAGQQGQALLADGILDGLPQDPMTSNFQLIDQPAASGEVGDVAGTVVPAVWNPVTGLHNPTTDFGETTLHHKEEELALTDGILRGLPEATDTSVLQANNQLAAIGNSEVVARMSGTFVQNPNNITHESSLGLGDFSLHDRKEEQPPPAENIPPGLLEAPQISIVRSLEQETFSRGTDNVAETSGIAVRHPNRDGPHSAGTVVKDAVRSKAGSIKRLGEINPASAEPFHIASLVLSSGADVASCSGGLKSRHARLPASVQRAPEQRLDADNISSGIKSSDGGPLNNAPVLSAPAIHASNLADEIDTPPFKQLENASADPNQTFDMFSESRSTSGILNNFPPSPKPDSNHHVELAALEAELEALRASDEHHNRTIADLEDKLADAEPYHVAELQHLRRQVRHLNDVAKAREAERAQSAEETRRLTRHAQDLAADLANECNRVAAVRGELARCKLARARAERAQEEAVREAKGVKKAAWSLLNIEGVEGMVGPGFGDVGRALMALVEAVERKQPGDGRN